METKKINIIYMVKIIKKIRRGYWICPVCNHKNTGNLELCESCGSSQQKNKDGSNPFFLDSTSQEVTDPKELKEAYAGPDWICEYCGTSNDNLTDSCKQCGNPKGDKEEKKYNDQPQNLELPETTEEENKRRKLYWIIGSASAVIITLLLVWLLLPSNVPVKITGFSWQRSIDIEFSRLETEEGWDIPTGGTEVDHETRFHHNDRVLDHYESVEVQKSREVQTGTETVHTGTKDLGNGYYEDTYEERPVYSTEYYTETEQEPVYRDVPVYQTWYTYKIIRWYHDRYATSSGTSQTGLYWATYTLADKERVGGKTETYTVHLLSQEKEPRKLTYTCPIQEWQGYKIGEEFNAKVRSDKVLKLEKLE